MASSSKKSVTINEHVNESHRNLLNRLDGSDEDSPKSPRVLHAAKSMAVMKKKDTDSDDVQKIKKAGLPSSDVVVDAFGSKLKLNSSPEGKDKRNEKWKRQQEEKEERDSRVLAFREFDPSKLSRSNRKAYDSVDKDDKDQMAWFMEMDLDDKKSIKEFTKRMADDKKLKAKRKAMVEERKKSITAITSDGEEAIRRAHTNEVIKIEKDKMETQRKHWDTAARLTEARNLKLNGLVLDVERIEADLSEGRKDKKKLTRELEEKKLALDVLRAQERFIHQVGDILKGHCAVTDPLEGSYFAENLLSVMPASVLQADVNAGARTMTDPDYKGKDQSGVLDGVDSVGNAEWPGYSARVLLVRETEGRLKFGVIAQSFEHLVSFGKATDGPDSRPTSARGDSRPASARSDRTDSETKNKRDSQRSLLPPLEKQGSKLSNLFRRKSSKGKGAMGVEDAAASDGLLADQ